MQGIPVIMEVQSVDDFWRVTFQEKLLVDAFRNHGWQQVRSIQIDNVLFKTITDSIDKHIGGI